MGTRNLIIVVEDKKHKVAQYCQWDGYPEGQGKTCYNVLKNPLNLTLLAQSLTKCYFGSEEDFMELWRTMHESVGEEFTKDSGVSLEASMAMKMLHPQLQRDHGALVLETIIDATERVPLADSIDFVTDHLFCEWVWIIDFDDGLFQAFRPRQYYEGNKKVENQKSYLDTLDINVDMTKVMELDLDNLPKDEEEFLQLF